MNNLYYSLLLLFRHLIITRQAAASCKDIRADIYGAAGDIGVASGSAVTLHRYERVHAVDGLHVHGLPSSASWIATICSTDYILKG